MLVDIFKKKRKPKTGLKKAMKTITQSKSGVKKDKLKGTNFYSGQDGHWRRNYKVYLNTMKQKKFGETSTFGISVLEKIVFSNIRKQKLDNLKHSYI